MRKNFVTLIFATVVLAAFVAAQQETKTVHQGLVLGQNDAAFSPDLAARLRAYHEEMQQLAARRYARANAKGSDDTANDDDATDDADDEDDDAADDADSSADDEPNDDDDGAANDDDDDGPADDDDHDALYSPDEKPTKKPAGFDIADDKTRDFADDKTRDFGDSGSSSGSLDGGANPKSKLKAIEKIRECLIKSVEKGFRNVITQARTNLKKCRRSTTCLLKTQLKLYEGVAHAGHKIGACYFRADLK